MSAMDKRDYDPTRDPLEQVQAMDGAQELFVPVHGHILLYPEEIAIIDHPSFQRLRRVRQLGLAHMVFPGATHTRFEHSVGAVHVAQLIISHVNHNFRKKEPAPKQLLYGGITMETARLIRLGALLHDIGHLPYGHTLEDELQHLRPHDGAERMAAVADRKHKQYELIGREGISDARNHTDGWSLRELVDHLYGPTVQAFGLEITAFDLLIHIVSKRPKDKEALTKWNNQANLIEQAFDLAVCRDVVGNTICADFLDYLYRDWHHLGKPLYLDKRLYEYMEVRIQRPEEGEPTSRTRFVINVGANAQKVRHDALTDILELLNARYKLAETVLFHRTKLALTGLLDRCLLETARLFKIAGLPATEHQKALEGLLLESSDDGLVGVMKKLGTGGQHRSVLQQAKKKEKETLQKVSSPTSGLYSEPLVSGDLQEQSELIEALINRLEGREVYRLAYKLKISDLTGPHNPKNPKLVKLLTMYRDPQNRLDFLRGLEALCSLPVGSLVMYCPPDARMNAKIAEVNLLVGGAILPFDRYEEDSGESGLTRGALKAQVQRFYELWSAHVFVERSCWSLMSKVVRRHLQSVIKCFFFQDQDDPGVDLKVIRSEVQISVAKIGEQDLIAARGRYGNPLPVENHEGFQFPSGLPFAIDK